jgi:hypothetical protein
MYLGDVKEEGRMPLTYATVSMDVYPYAGLMITHRKLLYLGDVKEEGRMPLTYATVSMDVYPYAGLMITHRKLFSVFNPWHAMLNTRSTRFAKH